jgi:ribonuclease J
LVKEDVLKERQQLAEDGVVTVAMAVSLQGKLMAKPELHLRGVVTTLEKKHFQEAIARTLEKTLSESWSDLTKTSSKDKIQVDWLELRTDIECALKKLLRRELQSNPLLVLLMQTPEDGEVGEKPVKKTASSTGRRRRRSAARVAS